MKHRVVIGVDESGTGAWAGPFTVCAVALLDSHLSWLKCRGVRDSKELTDKRRRALVEEIADVAIGAGISVIGVEDYNKGLKQAWRKGCLDAICHVIKLVEKSGIDTLISGITIDGNTDAALLVGVRELISGVPIRFVPKADRKIIEVGAASVVAKTRRNDLMAELHLEFPEYLWNKNNGYGSDEHRGAISKYGVTSHHRNLKPLRGVTTRR